MKKWTGIIGGLVLGTIAGSFLVGPLLMGQPQPPKGVVMPQNWASYRDVVKQVLPAVVSIDTESKAVSSVPKMQGSPHPFDDSQLPDEFKKFFEDFRKSPFKDFPSKPVPRVGFGSGFIIDPDGVIMTNYHVVSGASKVTIHLLDGRKFVTTEYYGDEKTDLAIVKIDTKGKKLPALEFGDSAKMEIGDRVLAVGAPFGLSGSVTHGIVSAKGRNGLNMNMYEDFLQTDAAINPGNSGGPLINLEGKVIGINTAIKTRNGGFSGVGLAISSNLAKNVKDALIRDGKVQRGYLGVQIVDLEPDVAAKFGLPKGQGVVVGNVFSNSPAAKGGLKAGDIILSVNGKAIPDGKQLQNTVVGLPLNKAADMEIFRDGKKQTLQITIEEQPNTFGQASAPALQQPQPQNPAVSVDKIGIEVNDLTPAMASKLGYEAGASGVVITNVEANSLAFTAGLRSGMLIVKIDNQNVSTAQAARDAFAKASLENGVLLQIRSPQGGVNYLMLKVKTN